MILLVDVGNTNIVIGGAKDGEIIFRARVSTDRNLTSDQYCIQIKNILDIYGIDLFKINGCSICSVVPQVLNEVKNAIFTLIKQEPFIVKSGIKTGLNILIDNPAQLGNDLVVNAVYAINKFDGPIIIVDMGTATTFSVIDQNKNYLGGLILAGVRLSLDALSKGAAQLPFISLDMPKNVVGKNTIDCMKNGVVYGAAATIDGVVERIEKDLGAKATIVATGGLSNHIIPFCKYEIIYDEDLLLKGLYLIYQKNSKKPLAKNEKLC